MSRAALAQRAFLQWPAAPAFGNAASRPPPGALEVGSAALFRSARRSVFRLCGAWWAASSSSPRSGTLIPRAHSSDSDEGLSSSHTCSWSVFQNRRAAQNAALGYQSQFRASFSSHSGHAPKVNGLVAGAQLSWADDASLGLERRAILSFLPGHPSTVLLVSKTGDARAEAKLWEVAGWLHARGLGVVVEAEMARSASRREQRAVAAAGDEDGVSGSSSFKMPPVQPFSQSLASHIDLCVTLGGDGTVLHLASLFVDGRPMPPVISFAMGTLGFLTPFTAASADAVLQRLLSPSSQADPIFCTLRVRKACEVHRAGEPVKTHRVLNECLVDRGSSPSMALLECFVDGRHLTSVQADGLIIATSSGSTAYSMSAGGPMVAPSVPCTLLTPVAPHSLSFRPIVVPEHSVIEVHVPKSARGEVRASFDGRHTTAMPPDSYIICRTSSHALPMISMHPLDEDWYEGITQKLKWTGSLRDHQGRVEAIDG
ncbi:ATP-NAD kinase [Helicosporidium sp. ATCC 50920]|nr:ATP-NAD kinase [Helicosporidium sp. ATCC 50920]|eukprot:KDD75820.1 ATP-NAD kinase [Helicosporidium sp. ATCC 50920]